MSTTIDHEDLQESRRADFEQQVVYKCLRAGGVTGQIRQFKAEQLELSGSPHLTLAWLRKRYPAFPLRLGAVLLAEGAPPWLDLFSRFTRTEVFTAYGQWCKRKGIDDHKETVGLVFNMEGVTFVLNNYQAAAERPSRRVIREVGTPPVAFAFEELGPLLGSIGRGWAASISALREDEE
jgi:hypothetical protein